MNEQYIVYHVSKLKKGMSRVIEKEMKRYGIIDIAPSHGNILTVLNENNGLLPMKEIAEKIGKDKSTVTALAKKLERAGYVDKIQFEDDRRMTFVVLNRKGQEVECIYRKVTEDTSVQAYCDFNNHEKRELIRLIKKLDNNL